MRNGYLLTRVAQAEFRSFYLTLPRSELGSLIVDILHKRPIYILECKPVNVRIITIIIRPQTACTYKHIIDP